MRQFARRFWGEASRGASVACAECHFGLAIWPRQWEAGNWTNYFECYERIYSPCCRAPKCFGPPKGPTPLRVVFFNEHPERDPASREWFREMRKTCDVRIVRAFTLRLPERRAPDMVSRYLVYEFRARSMTALPAARSPAVADRQSLGDDPSPTVSLASGDGRRGIGAFANHSSPSLPLPE
jgi:hypothetical protein